MKFCIFDVSNLVYRIAMVEKSKTRSGYYRAPVNPETDEEVEVKKEFDDLVNLSLATTIRSMRVPFDRFKANHAVMCFDHQSWRKKVFTGYKASRVAPVDEEPDPVKEHIFTAIGDFKTFLTEGSNTTVLHLRECEADDLIARWIANHPNDEHIIVSSDSDFKQLVSKNVRLFNGTTGVLYTDYGVFQNDGTKIKRDEPSKMIDGELWRIVLDENGNPETIDPSWMLFKKIMTGDKTDDIPRASPPRTKVKLLEEVYSHWGGIAWTSLMTAKRTDLPNEPTVAEVYEKSQLLIDLSKIPEDIKKQADSHIHEMIMTEKKKSLGMKFMVFCRERNMLALGNDAERYVPMLSAPYKRNEQSI
jgi:5'-3' exonuclease